MFDGMDDVGKDSEEIKRRLAAAEQRGREAGKAEERENVKALMERLESAANAAMRRDAEDALYDARLSVSRGEHDKAGET